MPEKLERKLAAILSADIAGYSALMGANEEATVRDLKAHQAVILPMIAKHGGHIIDTAGDGIFAEFPSVVNAVECAVALQKVMAERNASIPTERQMRYRIGVNLGDVIHDEQRVYGDGVNIAARLESIAEPGGIVISGKVFDEVQGKVDIEFYDLGAQFLKNIAAHVRAYRVRSKVGYPMAAPSEHLMLPDKPSIAVLPFTNMSGDPDQEFLGDGIAEDVLTQLSKLRWLFVIARNSSFSYKGKAIDIKRVANELGVRYVLEGSVRKAGNRARITGQLIEATKGAHVWAERYDRVVTDIFAVQDEITQAVVAAIGSAITDAERQRAVRKRPEDLGSWEAYQRGIWHQMKIDAAENELARTFFQRAIDQDPMFASAYSGLAGAILAAGANFHTMSSTEALQLAEPLARKAVHLDPEDPIARVTVGWIMYLKGDHRGAIREFDDALSIDANCDSAYGLKGASLILSGSYAAGREPVQHAIRLNPRAQNLPARFMILAFSQYCEKDYEGAVETAAQVIRRFPGHILSYRWLIASLGQLGRKAEAEAVMRIAPPAYDLYARERPAFMRPSDHKHMVEGLRKAGWKP